MIGRVELLGYWDGEDRRTRLPRLRSWASQSTRATRRVAADADPLRQAEARVFQRAARRRARVHMAVMAVLGVLAALAGARIADALDTPGGLLLDSVSYAWAALIAVWIAGLPFALLGWRANRRAGLSLQRLPSWLGDQGKSLAIGAVLAPFAPGVPGLGAAQPGRTAGGSR